MLVATNMYPSAGEPWHGSFVAEQVRDLRDLGVDISVFSFDGRQRRSEYAKAARRLRAVVAGGEFDLLHAHYGLTGAVAMAQRKLPVITTFWGTDTGYVRWQGWVSRIVARATVPVFVSQANAARGVGFPDARVIPSGVDTDLFVPQDRTEARRELGWPEEGPYVLLPGRRGRKVKNAALFDEVVGIARDAVPGLKPLSLEGFSRDEAVLVMNAVDVVLMTSHNEGSPVAVREALACMTPVVSVEVGDMPLVLQGLPGCGVFERDPGALAKGVLEALESGRREEELRERAEQYSGPQVARRILELYKEASAR